MKIIPAILASDVHDFDELVEQVLKISGVERVQVDFIDEEFSNQTIPVALGDVNEYKQFKWDAHLMLSMETMIDEVALAKISGYRRIIAQVESVEDQKLYIEKLQGFEKGLAIDLESGISAIEISTLDKLDVVLLMAVEAGFGGQLFDNRVIDKARELDILRKEKGYKYKICIDGGVEQIHLQVLEEVGVDEVAVGVLRMVDWKI